MNLQITNNCAGTDAGLQTAGTDPGRCKMCYMHVYVWLFCSTVCIYSHLTAQVLTVLMDIVIAPSIFASTNKIKKVLAKTLVANNETLVPFQRRKTTHKVQVRPLWFILQLQLTD